MTRWEWSNRVLSASGPESPTVRFVLVVLLSDYNESKGYAWPSAARLSLKTGFCDKTVRAALVEAETSGWLRKDAVPGHVTHYYPAVPEDRELKLTPVTATGVARKQLPGGPVAVTDDLRRYSSSEASRRRAEPPPCPQCGAPMKEERSRRTKEPMFWGCSRFRVTGCKGKLEFEEAEALAEQAEKKAAAVAESRAAIEAAEKAADEKRQREFAAIKARRAGPQACTDAKNMASMLLSGRSA